MPVFFMVKMTVFPKKLKELLQTLETLESSICKIELGCMKYRFYQEGDNENNVILILEWESQEKLASYHNSDEYKILMGAISLLCESADMKTGTVPMEVPHIFPPPAKELSKR